MSNINVMRKNLGPVTAYKYAVTKGFQGTEEEFAELMASYASIAQDVSAESRVAEGYALGKQNGVDVGDQSPYYHANAKYHAEQAAAKAQEAAESAAQAEGAIEVDDTLSVKGRAADSKAVGDRIKLVNAAMNGKYDRYTADYVSGLSLDMFDIYPSQYSIVQYDNTDALQHGAIPSGTTHLISKLDSVYKDIKLKVHYGAFRDTPSVNFAIAVNNTSAIAVAINATSGNVSLFTATTATMLSGIFRNPACRSIVADDTLHLVKDGTKVAIYLIDNGEDIPIFRNEWVDVIGTYPDAGFTSNDIAFGLVTSNSARNEPLIYNFSHFAESGDHLMSYEEADARLSALENGDIAYNAVDLIMFMGQSNMAGRGVASQAPNIIDGAGYEFRAISDPTKLYSISEPFGVDENVDGAIYDYLGGYKAKSGSMVTSFINAYYMHTKCPVVGVSASEGGTRISLWQPNTARFNDAVSRFNTAKTWLTTNGYTVRHKFILWCQGESNGDDGMSKADYKSAFETMAQALFAIGIDNIFVVKIGNYNGTGTQDYNAIMTAQNELCQTLEDVVMVSTDFASMRDRGLMKDDFHYKQAAYNEVGTYAGINTAFYVNSGKEPTMYDAQDGSLYFSHKN